MESSFDFAVPDWYANGKRGPSELTEGREGSRQRLVSYFEVTRRIGWR
jgi:hypothetical protein